MGNKGTFARGEIQLTNPIIWPLATGDDQHFAGRPRYGYCAANDARCRPPLVAHGGGVVRRQIM